MALKKEYQVFVDEMIKHGDEHRAYQKAYPKTKNKHAIRKGCLRLSQNVSVSAAIKTEVDKIKATATQQAIAELKNEIKGNILTRQQKQEILYKIAMGELAIPVKKPVWDHKQKKYVTISMMEVPDHAAMIKAIEIENKMSGDYAPEKWEHTGKDGNPIETMFVPSPAAIEYSKIPLKLRMELLKHVRANKPQE